ncbi:hypothetical protein VPNG_01012 [Cytospora leucostoma]|uniref:Phosphatidylinositol N-acetylglucosaminyltransferase subunit H conserved domain-containing protein n=1 Tax=Cytospora leucostoma TaxID=1230097 RepID=A0A423XKN0_9PEZI|nr:hypothetical protein VPNG_01012 [Cytospora leucostoma]
MLTTAPHLHIRRPSPTTAEFTVTTCPPMTISLRILLALVFLSRVLLSLSVLLLLYSTWTLSPYYHDPHATGIAVATPTAVGTVTISPSEQDRAVLGSVAAVGQGDNNYTTTTTNDHTSDPPAAPYTTTSWASHILRAAHHSPPGQTARHLAATVPAYILLPLCAALLYATTLRIHTTESLLVLRGLGIQTSSTGGSYLASWRAGTRFIPTEKIRDVLINEAFRGFAVRYYLVVVVDGEGEVVVVFPRLLPRRRIVEAVWRGVRGCLWEPDGSVGTVGSKRWDEKGACG